jgi:hypothetical protein
MLCIEKLIVVLIQLILSQFSEMMEHFDVQEARAPRCPWCAQSLTITTALTTRQVLKVSNVTLL